MYKRDYNKREYRHSRREVTKLIARDAHLSTNQTRGRMKEYNESESLLISRVILWFENIVNS